MWMPRFSIASAIFMEVVVLPDPEGPASSTIGLRARFSMILSAASSTSF